MSGNEPQYPDPSAKEARQEVLDFLVTEEQLGVTFVSAAIEKPPVRPQRCSCPSCVTW